MRLRKIPRFFSAEYPQELPRDVGAGHAGQVPALVRDGPAVDPRQGDVPCTHVQGFRVGENAVHVEDERDTRQTDRLRHAGIGSERPRAFKRLRDARGCVA